MGITINCQLTQKQNDALQYLLDKITIQIVFGGGAGGGKSQLGCFWIVLMCLQYPGSRWFIGRKTLQDLKKSTLLTLFDVLKRFGLKPGQGYRFNRTDNYFVINNSEVYLLDLDYYPSDPEYERLGSMEYTGGFVDEASQITQKCRDVLLSRIRYKLKEFGLTPKLLMTCNPTKNWLKIEFYNPWKKRLLTSDLAFIRALAKDNPFNPESYLNVLKNLKDKVLRERLWFGNWDYEDDPLALFKFDDISDMFTNTVDDSDDKFIVCDVARFGSDKTVVMDWEGLKVSYIGTETKMGTDKTELLLDHHSKKNKVPRSHELVDEDGIGGGVVDHRQCKGFIGGSSPIVSEEQKEREKEDKYKINYLNLRSQCYYTLADYVSGHKIAIQTDDNELYQQLITEELEQIKAKDVDKDGKMKVISKDEIKQHLGRSPDFADCLMMRMYFEVHKELELNLTWI